MLVGIANREYPDQTSSMCTVCQGLFDSLQKQSGLGL